MERQQGEHEQRRFTRLCAIFEEVRDLAREERLARLNELCGEDGPLRTEVESMLSAEGSGRFLESPLATDSPMLVHESGARIGSYRVVRAIGEGGMGVVYEAEQETPRRRVALKTLRRGAHATTTLRRLELEAQVLARLEHPGIARIYDAGTSGEGTPYLAMEFIENGVDVVTYARSRGLGEREVLKLFLEVCAAVEHGHRRGVIHRDLKPANVLVGIDGRARVIDFGIARVLAPSGDVEALTRVTRAGEIVGTLQWMAPEQVSGTDDVDTRTDVHALGILLYWLLYDRHPYELEGCSLTEIVRRVREAPAVDPVRLASERPRELAWIVLRALEKEPARRYASVDEMSADVASYLEHKPLRAGPPSALYRARKLVRRHRVGIAAASLALAGVLTGGLLRLRGLVREATEAQKFRGINEVLTRLLEGAQAHKAGREVPASALVARAVEELDGRDDLRPDVEAPLRLTLAKSFKSLDDPLQQEAQARKAHELYARIAAPDDDERLESAAVLARALSKLDRHAEARAIFDACLPAARARFAADGARGARELVHGLTLERMADADWSGAHELAEWLASGARRRFGAEHPRTLDCDILLASVLVGLRRCEEAERVARSCVERSERLFSSTSNTNYESRQVLGRALSGLGRWDEAIENLEGILPAVVAVRGEDHVLVLSVKNDLARAYLGVGSPEKAANLVGRAVLDFAGSVALPDPSLVQARPDLGDMNARLADSAELLKQIEGELGESAAAERSLSSRAQEALQAPLGEAQEEARLRERVDELSQELGPDHPEVLDANERLGEFLRNHGQFEASERVLSANLERWRAVRGDRDLDVCDALEELAATCTDLRDFARAAQLLERSRAAVLELVGPDDVRTLRVECQLGTVWAQMPARRSDALELFPRALADLERLAPQDPDLLTLNLNLYQMRRIAGSAQEAEAAARRACEHAEAWADETHPLRAEAFHSLGTSLRLRGDLDGALEWFERAVQACEQAPTTRAEWRARYSADLEACAKQLGLVQ